MIIALPYENGEIFQHFGKTQQFVFFTIENRQVVNKEIVSTDGQGHSALGAFLKKYEVNGLICGGIGAGAMNFLGEADITVYPGNEGNVDEVIAKFLKGEVAVNYNASCSHHHEEGHSCGHHHDHEEGHDCGHHHCCK